MISKLLNNFKKNLFYFNYQHWKKGIAAPLAFPRLVHIENTNACPARCIICSMDKMTRKTGIMSFDLFEVLIRECAKQPEVEEVHLHGFGEPLIDKDLPKKVALAKNLGIPRTYIVTNGFLLTDQKAIELISAGLDGIKFSFYGMTKETYERIHRQLSFDKTVGNIETFFQVRDRLKAINPSVRFQFCPGLAPSQEFAMFLDKWKPFMDADRNDLFYSTGLHNWAGAKEDSQLIITETERYCAWPFKDIQILWDGRVIPCVFDYDGTLSLGDVNKSTIAEIWSSDKYRTFRNIWLNKKSLSIPLCAKCNIPEGIFSTKTLDAAFQPVSSGIICKRKRFRYRFVALVTNFFRDFRVWLKYRNGE